MPSERRHAHHHRVHGRPLRRDHGVRRWRRDDVGDVGPDRSPFFTTKEHGTGLGLSTCRSIAAEAGGTLTIESRVGAGTRVTARLSAVREDAVGD